MANINPNVKKLLALLSSFAFPPLGLILAAWLLVRGSKQKITSYIKWAVYILIAAVLGSTAYLVIYLQNDNQQDLTYPTTASQSDITVCLDGEQTIIITEDSPYNFDIGDSDASGRISPTLARVFIDNNNGDFEIGVGDKKGKHHIDEGKCPDSE